MRTAEPLDLAIRTLAETRKLLQLLITSSESFDYPKAKIALSMLSEKIKALEDVQRTLSRQQPLNNCSNPAGASPRVIAFPSGQDGLG
jgi:hypothetical protein